MTILVKIAGPSTLLYINRKSGSPSIGAEVAVQILYNISLSPLLAGTLSFVNGSTSESGDRHNVYSGRRKRSCQRNQSQRLRLAHLLIIAGLILGILGGIDRAPKSSTGQINPEEYNHGATFLKVAAFLFLAALLAITWGLTSSWRDRSVTAKTTKYAMVAAAISLPFILVHLIYSFLSSFNLNTTTTSAHSSTFNMLTGNWIVYLIMVFIPQLVIVGVYNTAGILGRKGNVSTVSRGIETKIMP